MKAARPKALAKLEWPKHFEAVDPEAEANGDLVLIEPFVLGEANVKEMKDISMIDRSG